MFWASKPQKRIEWSLTMLSCEALHSLWLAQFKSVTSYWKTHTGWLADCDGKIISFALPALQRHSFLFCPFPVLLHLLDTTQWREQTNQEAWESCRLSYERNMSLTGISPADDNQWKFGLLYLRALVLTLYLFMRASFFLRRASIFLSSSRSLSWSLLGITSLGVWEEKDHIIGKIKSTLKSSPLCVLHLHTTLTHPHTHHRWSIHYEAQLHRENAYAEHPKRPNAVSRACLLTRQEASYQKKISICSHVTSTGCMLTLPFKKICLSNSL